MGEVNVCLGKRIKIQIRKSSVLRLALFKQLKKHSLIEEEEQDNGTR